MQTTCFWGDLRQQQEGSQEDGQGEEETNAVWTAGHHGVALGSLPKGTLGAAGACHPVTPPRGAGSPARAHRWLRATPGHGLSSIPSWLRRCNSTREPSRGVTGSLQTEGQGRDSTHRFREQAQWGSLASPRSCQFQVALGQERERLAYGSNHSPAHLQNDSISIYLVRLVGANDMVDINCLPQVGHSRNTRCHKTARWPFSSF